MRPDVRVSATYSLVAHDAAGGRFGAAVASRCFAAGALVPHLLQGVGVFNTQHCHFHRLAEHGLRLMAGGAAPQAAIEMVLSVDEQPDKRQLLAMDAHGRKGAWTGAECQAARKHAIGETCVAAGNTLAAESVVEAMVAYMDGHPDEPFGLRLIRALEAAEAEGGDKRGKQAAAVKTCPDSLEVWGSDYVDLRVDDHPEPLTELMRLYEMRWKGKA